MGLVAFEVLNDLRKAQVGPMEMFIAFILLMEEILHQLRLVVYPSIHRVLYITDFSHQQYLQEDMAQHDGRFEVGGIAAHLK